MMPGEDGMNRQNMLETKKKDEEGSRKNWEIMLFGLHLILFGLCLLFSFLPDSKHSYIYSVKTFRLIDSTVKTQSEFLSTFGNLSTIDAINQTFSASSYYNALAALNDKVPNFNKDGVCYTRAMTQEISWGSSSTYYSSIDNSRQNKVSKWWLLYLITGVTFLAHAIRFFKFDHIQVLIDNHAPRWDRWFEYTLSSPLMIILIAYSSGTVEASALLLLFASQAMLVITGLAIEVFCYEGSRELRRLSYAPVAPEPQPIPNVLPVVPDDPFPLPTVSRNYAQQYQQQYQQQQYQPMRPITIKTPFSKNSPQTLQGIADYNSVRYVKMGKETQQALGYNRFYFYNMILLGISWFVFIFQWTVIIWNLNDMLTVFKCVNSMDLSARTAIPILIVILEFMAFFGFGAIATYNSFSWNDYDSKGAAVNLYYNILSAASKVILTIILIAEARAFKQN